MVESKVTQLSIGFVVYFFAHAKLQITWSAHLLVMWVEPFSQLQTDYDSLAGRK